MDLLFFRWVTILDIIRKNELQMFKLRLVCTHEITWRTLTVRVYWASSHRADDSNNARVLWSKRSSIVLRQRGKFSFDEEFASPSVFWSAVPLPIKSAERWSKYGNVIQIVSLIWKLLLAFRVISTSPENLPAWWLLSSIFEIRVNPPRICNT